MGNDSSASNLLILLDGEKNLLLCPLLYSPTFPSICLPCLSLPFAFHSFIPLLAFRFFFPLTYCCKSFTKPLSSYTTLPFSFLYNISLILSLWSLYFSFCFCPYTWFPLLLQFHTFLPHSCHFSLIFCFVFLTLLVSNQFSFFFFSLHRDVRRLVVAMSRARLGLYIFARVSLFQNCFELTPAFNQLTARPLQLHIRPHEYYSQEQPVRTVYTNQFLKAQ